MQRIMRAKLAALCEHNVCEIVFTRRDPDRAAGRYKYRKMFCSRSMELLNSENGIRSLNFRLPRGPVKINEATHNIVVVWDLLMQDYRNVSMDRCFLIRTIPDDDTFWRFYNEILLPMSPSEKLAYMDLVY